MNRKESYGLDLHLARFGTDKQCYDFLFSVRWGTQPICSFCGNNHMNYYISTRKTYKCSDCHKQFSLTQKTMFEKSRIPLTKWFIAIYFFTTNKRGISSIQLSKLLSVSQRTAWFMLHRLRIALKEENNIILSGIIEVDETFIMPNVNRDTRLQRRKQQHYSAQKKIHGLTKKNRLKLGLKQKRGRKKGTTKEVIEQMKLERGGKPYRSDKPSNIVPFENGAIVLGMMERDGKVVMKKLGFDRRCINHENVLPLLQQHIQSGSTIITDQHIVYQSLPSLPFCSEHLSVNHEIGYVINGIHINGIENAWKHLKKLLDSTYFHVSKQHINGYLDENTYRWNRRQESERTLFEDFIPLVLKKHLFNHLKQQGLKIAA